MTRMSRFVFSVSIFLFSVSAGNVFSLDLSDAGSSLADAFGWSSDDNEGLSSFRSLNIPVGGRAESLGTACTALCDDVVFFDYNPAASSVDLPPGAAHRSRTLLPGDTGNLDAGVIADGSCR